MTAVNRKALLLGAVLAAAALAATASADGLPVLGVDVGAEGVAARTSPVRYVTLPAGEKTIVARTATQGGRVLRVGRVRGTFTIPAVAYDGSASGLSADGRTLVLIQPRRAFPRLRTSLAVLDTSRLRVRQVVTLDGDFSFDAVSPRGRTLFLIQYVNPNDPREYAVRAYDLRAGRLLPDPVVDPHERGEAMRGSPLSRAMSPDGRWAYTLYDGAGATPFIHALDTSRREARCIDVDLLQGRQDLWQQRLSVGPGGQIRVGKRGETVALVDPRTFAVNLPPAPVIPSPSGDSRPWLPLGAAAAATALAAAMLAFVLRRRRGASAATAAEAP